VEANVTTPIHNIAAMEKWNLEGGRGISVEINVTIPIQLRGDAVMIIKYLTSLPRVVVWYMREIKNIPFHHQGRSG
jgi:hypothetical protein